MDDERARLISCPKCGEHSFEVSNYYYYDKTKRCIEEVSYTSGKCFRCNYVREFSEQLVRCPTCGCMSFGIIEKLHRLDDNKAVLVSVNERPSQGFSSKNPCLTLWMCFSCGHRERLMSTDGRVCGIFWSKKFPRHRRQKAYYCPKCNTPYIGMDAKEEIKWCDDCWRGPQETYYCPECQTSYDGIHGMEAITYCRDCGRLGCLHCGLRKYLRVGDEWIEESNFMKGKDKPKAWHDLWKETLCLSCLAERES